MKHEFTIAPGELLRDLHRAYLDARKNKWGKEYQLRFEYRLEENLVALRDELLSRRYRPRRLLPRLAPIPSCSHLAIRQIIATLAVGFN